MPHSIMSTLKPQSNGPLYTHTTIRWLVHWPLDSGLLHLVQQKGASPSPLFVVPNATAHPSTASVSTSYYSIVALYICTLKGWIPLRMLYDIYVVIELVVLVAVVELCLPCAALSWGQPTWQGLGFSGLVHEETQCPSLCI